MHASPPLVKICGVTSLDDVQAAILAGADWIGLNFHPASPRRISHDLAAEILATFGDHATFAGVFVDRDVTEVTKLARSIGLKVVQLHGSEPDSDVLALRSAAIRVIRAFRIGDSDAVDRLLISLERSADAVGDFLLLDAFVAGQPGGTGQSIADEVLDRLPIEAGTLWIGANRRIPLILAGGLNPLNVADRVSKVHPWMVDVASGVESSPGRKSRELMDSFVLETKGASPRSHGPCRNAPLGATGSASVPPVSALAMFSYTIDDPITDPLVSCVEVTVDFGEGNRRWCIFATPAHLATCGNLVEGTRVRWHPGVPHMILVSELSERIIDDILTELFAEHRLETHTIQLV